MGLQRIRHNFFMLDTFTFMKDYDRSPDTHTTLSLLKKLGEMMAHSSLYPESRPKLALGGIELSAA